MDTFTPINFDVTTFASTASKCDHTGVATQSTLESIQLPPIQPGAVKKKKRKKQSYRDMMQSMTGGTKTDAEVQQEQQDKIAQCTGGGTFAKGNLTRI